MNLDINAFPWIFVGSILWYWRCTNGQHTYRWHTFGQSSCGWPGWLPYGLGPSGWSPCWWHRRCSLRGHRWWHWWDALWVHSILIVFSFFSLNKSKSTLLHTSILMSWVTSKHLDLSRNRFVHFSVIKEQTHCYHDLTGSLSRMTCPRHNLVAVLSPQWMKAVFLSQVCLCLSGRRLLILGCFLKVRLVRMLLYHQSAQIIVLIVLLSLIAKTESKWDTVVERDSGDDANVR